MVRVSDLNLATQPFVNRRRFYVLATASAVALSLSLVVLAGAFVHSFRSERGIRRDLRKVRDEVAGLEARQKRIEDALAEPQAADALDRSEFLNGLIRQKAVSWTRIFMDLEKVMPDRVEVVTLHPVLKLPGSGIKATAGAPALLKGPLVMDLLMTANSENFQGLLDLLHHLQNSQNFTKPIVSGDSLPNANGVAQPISIVPRNPSAGGYNEERVYSLVYSVTYAQ
jgi:hypothetical protein